MLATVSRILQTRDQVPPRHAVFRTRHNQTSPRYSSGEKTAPGCRQQWWQEERTSRAALGHDVVVLGRVRLLQLHRLSLDVSCLCLLVHSAPTVPDRF